MRRRLGMVTVAALLQVLFCSMPCSAFSTPLHARPVDFSRQIFQRLFGESTDHRASLAAAYGDAMAESPLRDLALRVNDVSSEELADADDVRDAVQGVSLPQLSSRLFARMYFSRPTFSTGEGRYAAATVPTEAPVALATDSSTASPQPLVAYYQAPSAEAPAGGRGASSFRFNLSSNGTANAGSPLVTFSPVLDPTQAYDAPSGVSNAGTQLPSTQATVNVPVRVGRVRFETHAEAAQAQAPQINVQDQAVGGGATIDVRAGSRNVGVNLGSQFEHLTANPPNINGSSFDSTSSWGLANDNVPVLVPAYADVSKRTVSAGVAVPVTRALTANVQYDQQHLLGGYGTPGLSNLDARNDVYGAQLTFRLPHSASAISLSAKQYRFQDNIVPQNQFTQTSANLNFTVKF